jgi:hypothetical protein
MIFVAGSGVREGQPAGCLKPTGDIAVGRKLSINSAQLWRSAGQKLRLLRSHDLPRVINHREEALQVFHRIA